MTQPQSRSSILALPALWAAPAAAVLALVAGSALAAGSVLDDPIATTRVPDGTTTYTQTREQNAVTSVQVRRGDNVYTVTPPEQIPSNLGGGRAATWEVFQFKPRRSDDRRAAPPPN